MNEDSGAGRPPRPRWWLGPIGVLLGVIFLLLAVFGGLFRFPTAFLISIVVVPAVLG